MDDHEIRPLTAETWDAFADLAERHNGVWGGCWCTWFHPACEERGKTAEGNRAYKERLVREGRAHAALVFDGDTAIAWAEYGTPDELPVIHHQKQYLATLDRLPDFRITCLFVDKHHRREGVAELAVRGAVELIAQAGGGIVEGYPHEVPPGKKVSASFLYNATRTLYERVGFTFVRPKGQGNTVMRMEVPDSRGGTRA
ncbi:MULTISPECIES: hypothetical protein [unclassified Leifsonia]|uniref:hypothetical protein n=1 Tax=unclassified Leifsonia TaxID=2663824 RepID=UPI000701DA2C|nr:MULTISPECIES: hypothetical protein [unclassified Leifsonia]KQX07592.1 acetyltransferase [Leifsonia sp. Root1293]KRA11874.1 acetyltransferase [Leifsonia sp. Root60]